jgi:hypothetical protein
MTTIAVAAPTDFEQQLDAEIVRLTDMKQDLQGQLDDIEASIDQVEKFRESYEPHPRSVIRTPEPATKTATKKDKAPKSSDFKGKRAARKSGGRNSAADTADLITEHIKKNGPSTIAQIHEANPETPYNSIASRIRVMAEDGRATIVKPATRGPGGAGIYGNPSKQVGGAKPATKKAAPPADSGTQQPLLEGRIFSLLQYQRLSSQKLADELDADVDDVRKVLAKLLADDEVRKFGETPYDTWEGTGL